LYDTGRGGVTDELTLDPSWQGLDAPAGQLEVDVAALLEAADRLEREADFLAGSGTGTPARLAELTNLPCASFGGWQTAYEMEAGHTEARRHVVNLFDDVVQVLLETAALARRTALAHQQTDEAIRARLQGQQAALADGDRSTQVA
jgi:hypothetical protein